MLASGGLKTDGPGARENLSIDRMNRLAVNAGLVVIVGTHVWLLNDLMPPAVQKYHAWGNLAAAGLVAYGVFA